jgi:hypothetical protein
MGKFNKHQGDRDRFGKCQICLEYIPIEYYFGTGDTIICYGCGTEYIIESKSPIKLNLAEGFYEPDGYENDIFQDTDWEK